MLTIDPKNISTPELHSYLLGAIAPRPIAFASTVDKTGNINLSPYSFFNCFGANPPILVFSPARRGRDNTTKDTFENIKEVGETVINIVNYPIVEQMSLSSTEYPKGVNEFEKAGLTAVESVMVKPPRVKESPAAFECKVIEVIETGTEGGAGNLVICEVILAHFNEDILDKNNKINPFKLDAVARMGGNYYCRAQGDALFEIPKPNRNLGIGFDNMPEEVKNSKVLTGNNLGRLGNIEALPSEKDILAFNKSQNLSFNDVDGEKLHHLAKKEVEKGDIETAWKILLTASYQT